jgi:UDP-N-acetylmuramoylalanine--D-glutamate ligase
MRTSPAAAAVLNLYEEHLDYYKSADRYYAAKVNIARHQDHGDDYLIIGDNAGDVSPFLRERADRVVSCDADRSYDLRLHGKHNQFNAEFVKCICMDLGLVKDEAAIRRAMADFEGLPHRLEFIGEQNGVRYYDDSISTIPEAAIAAAESVDKTATILIGGMDRGIDYTLLLEFMKKRRDIRFICMYEAGERICSDYHRSREKPEDGDEHVFYRKDLGASVELAKEITPTGYACLLSPAAASYGHFKNFEERGERFREEVFGAASPNEPGADA